MKQVILRWAEADQNPDVRTMKFDCSYKEYVKTCMTEFKRIYPNYKGKIKIMERFGYVDPVTNRLFRDKFEIPIVIERLEIL